MKQKRSSSPQTRSTSHGSSGAKFEVFLSFRGPDTRANFTDTLYYALLDKGIRVFIDKKGIDVGEEIGPEIFQAIDDSKICIPIFSKGYAFSSWCLRELEHMMQRKKTNNLEVLPIFYDVEPSDVKLETEVYKNALTLHKKERGLEIVQQWEEALKEVTKIKGWDTKNIGYGELTRLIAHNVLIKLKVSSVHISNDLVGMDKLVNEIVDLLNVESQDVRIIGIWGMGGIGKTTLAKVVYRKLSNNFESHGFIANVREASKKSGLPNLQRQLVSSIIGDVGVELSIIDHGMNMIQDRFCGKKVLIVLDDVDHRNQLMALAAKAEWFGSGSRIIVTTRDRSVLSGFQDQFDHCLIYETKELKDLKALELFSKHAFRSNSPPNAFLSLSKKVTSKTRGLPLAIEVIGSFLCGKTKEGVWQDTLKKMDHFLHKDVKEKLMLSYEALDHPQQQIFLDIACFLSGEDTNYATYMWDDWIFSESIVYEENRKDPTKGSRLWRGCEDGSHIFQQKGTKTVAAQYSRLQPPPQVPVLTLEELNKMPNIRFLDVWGCTLSGDFVDLFSKLRWLNWLRCPEEMQATNFCPKNLVILVLRWGDIDERWGGWTQLKAATKLKVLDLSDCTKLKETPDLSAFLSLEILILYRCEELMELSDSIGMLKHLAELDVSYTNIVELPNTIVNLKSLKVLKMNGSLMRQLPKAIGMMEKLEEIYANNCKRLEMIPSDLVRLQSLKILKLTGICVKNAPELPQSLVATRLKVLDLSNCTKLKETPEFFAFLSLEILILCGCEELMQLSDSIGMLKHLVELDVSYTSIAELPNTIVNLKSLKVLKMNGSLMRKLPEAIGMMEKLEEIYANNCKRLEMIPSDILTETCVENVPELPRRLQRLVATGLEVLDLSNCRMLKETPELSAFLSLKALILRGCEMLTRLSNSIEMLKYLAELDISNTSITELPNTIVNLKSLKMLRMNNSCIQKLPKAIGMMEKLEEIYGERCMRLEMIPSDIVRLPILKILKLTGTRMENVPKLPQSLLPYDLRKLIVDNCKFLEVVDLSNLSNFKNLEHLKVQDCPKLVEIRGLDTLESLEYLFIECCSPLLCLPDLSNWKKLKEWDVDALATYSARGKQVAQSNDLPL
ncbi:hypothetical protein BT93_C1021 [Corymbia citriodora subsp. variegata]|nr:hypothetical protein BT93_C1021 [Corymbia citriodora subsp. variegata]